ncbi:hypothetical protein ACS0TY_016433 [Phlomoides rotata]
MEDGDPEIKDMVEEEREGGCNCKEEKNSGGGVISNFISTMVSKNGHEKVEMEEIKQEEEKGGGIFNNLISGILNHGGGGGEDGKREGNEAEDGGGGGGLIDSLVSHLPPPLADDAAPAPDEASILIHSIIHD